MTGGTGAVSASPAAAIASGPARESRSNRAGQHVKQRPLGLVAGHQPAPRRASPAAWDPFIGQLAWARRTTLLSPLRLATEQSRQKKLILVHDPSA
jgi:hypothetical protein